jgi:predicted ArsR family transcriptional regulator
VELSEDEGEEKIDRLFEKRRDKLLNKYAKSLEGKPLEDKVALLADIQNANGYMVDWKQGTEGQYILQEFNCPIAQVARQFNQACRCELELFERLLGTEVEQTECMAKGGGKCVYVIQSQ